MLLGNNILRPLLEQRTIIEILKDINAKENFPICPFDKWLNTMNSLWISMRCVKPQEFWRKTSIGLNLMVTSRYVYLS